VKELRIAGAGLAGCAAALSAIRHGAKVQMWDPAPVPKHKVCGEFLTPEVQRALESLDLWEPFLQLRPARMYRSRLFFGDSCSEGRFESPAFGLSRFQLDRMMRDAAIRAGAVLHPERAPQATDIYTCGRRGVAIGRNRVFGFKAHFAGRANDAVELYFKDGLYVGVNPVEDGITNICGIGPERTLRQHRFDYEQLIASWPALRERVSGLRQQTKWYSTGPLVYESRLADRGLERYCAGDALQFVDPFTGSGMTVALWTGALAGSCAAKGAGESEYRSRISAGIATQFRICSVLRGSLTFPVVYGLARKLPVKWLFAMTRPETDCR
jgi:hypothetical protein